MKTYLALIRNDIRLAFRQKIVIFFNYLLPLAFFFIFAQSSHAEQGGAILQVVTMVIVIGILGNGLLGGGMRAATDRETNILRRYKVAPITPLPLLIASTVTGLIVYLPCVILILGLSIARYGMAMPSNIGTVMLFVVIALIAIRSIGLIIASTVNSMQENGVIVQVVYMGMLFLCGATFPASMFPNWLLIATQFIPATYVFTGLQGILLRHESLLTRTNFEAVTALILTSCIGLFLCVKLFRWEKEEKVRPAAKLWLMAVLIPFFVLGSYQAYAKDNVRKAKILARQVERSRTRLIRNARIFIGDGRVIENGGILVKDGRIAEIYDRAVPDPKSLNAQAIEAAGKTVLPGLIDVHVHLGASGGIGEDYQNVDPFKQLERELAAYLYSGVTAVRSAGDLLDPALEVRQIVNSGEKEGSEFFTVGPLFTTPGGHGTEYFRFLPDNIRQRLDAQVLRMPKTADEARADVNALKKQDIDGIKAILEAGAGGVVYNRLDLGILNAIGTAARDAKVPLLVHTGNAADVEDALKAGASSIEHGSFQQSIPDADFAAMARSGVSYDPTLSVAEAFPAFAAGKLDVLNRSLVQQVVPAKTVELTRSMINSAQVMALRKSLQRYPIDMGVARDNLLRAWKSGVMLVTGSDAGNTLVFHGPTVQREVELWVEAGIPPKVALQAATLNAAKALRAESRFGSIEKGKDATMVIVDGNPLEEVKALESISLVMFKGERIDRANLFDQN